MCGGSDPAPAPKAPDPYDTANAQYQYNHQAAIDSSFLNAIDQYSPYGSTVWARRPDGTPYAQSTTLSPEVQAWLDSQFAASTKLMDAAQTQLGFLPTDKFTLPESPSARDYASQAYGEKVLDYNRFVDPMEKPMYQSTRVDSGSTRDIGFTPSKQNYTGNVNAQDIEPTSSLNDIVNTSYQQAMSLVQPDIDAARKQKQIELANRGIPVGSEIYNSEMNRLDRSENTLRQQASRQAILDSGAEQTRQFGQNLQEAQFGSGEDARRLANQQFAAQFGQTENERLANQYLAQANYYNADDLARRQFTASEDARLANADLANKSFLGNYQNQQFNQLTAAMGYGNQAYQQNLSNTLLERNQPYVEAAALMGINPQFQQPQFMNTAALNVAAPDYAGVVNNNYAGAVSYANAANAAQAQSNSGLMQGIGAIGSAAVKGMFEFSDENLKENRHPADGELILMKLRDVPVDDYDYMQEARYALGVPEHRTGPMAGDWQEQFPEGSDGHMIDMGDILGKLVVAVQALDKRTEDNGKGRRRGR